MAYKSLTETVRKIIRSVGVEHIDAIPSELLEKVRITLANYIYFSTHSINDGDITSNTIDYIHKDFLELQHLQSAITFNNINESYAPGHLIEPGDVDYVTKMILESGFSYKDLTKGVDKRTKAKSKGLVRGTRYDSIRDDGAVVFRTPSAHYSKNRKYYEQTILPVELEDVKNMSGMSLNDKTNLALSGDLKVSCSCKAFQYWGYEYILTQLDANYYDRDSGHIFPKVRNPKLEGTICKHLYIALSALGNVTYQVAKDYRAKGIL